VLSIVLIVALGYVVVDRFRVSKSVKPQNPATATTTAPSDKSIAVLPFTDMSESKDQEYFADGMAEEIINLLARIPSLTVIGRTSSFHFKGANEDLRIVGKELNVGYVVEGGIRKAGSRIRVTAQLIDTRSGTHRWSESYDRDFGDVLALQSQIATSIARALQLAVGADDTRPPRLLHAANCANVPGWPPTSPVVPYTSSPGRNLSTLEPTASTTPARSRPKMAGSGWRACGASPA
jgi:TolB-like protein